MTPKETVQLKSPQAACWYDMLSRSYKIYIDGYIVGIGLTRDAVWADAVLKLKL